MKILRKVDSFLKKTILDYLRIRDFSYKYEYDKFFKKLIPEVFSYPLILFNFVIMVIACFVGGVILDLIIFIPLIALIIWWKKIRKDLRDNLYQKAKEDYESQRISWCNCGFREEIFKDYFPDWESALRTDFKIKVTTRICFEYLNSHKKGDKILFNVNPNELENAMKIFGITSLQNITQKELKHIYHTLAKKYHPDINPKYTTKFQNIGKAYDTLKAYV